MEPDTKMNSVNSSIDDEINPLANTTVRLAKKRDS